MVLMALKISDSILADYYAGGTKPVFYILLCLESTILIEENFRINPIP